MRVLRIGFLCTERGGQGIGIDWGRAHVVKFGLEDVTERTQEA